MTITESQFSTKIKSACQYAEAGFTIIKLNGKIPVEKDWTHADYIFPQDIPDYLSEWNGNFGVVLGKYDLVIDIDPRNFPPGDKPHVRLFKDIGVTDIMKFNPIVKTGTGGLHVYCKLPKNFTDHIKEILKEYPGIEFKHQKRQVVGAGSTHPDTGRMYAFVNATEAGFKAIAEAPMPLLQLVTRAPIKKSASKPLIGEDDPSNIKRYTEWLLVSAPIAKEGENGDKTTYMTACKGRDMGLSKAKTLDCMLHFYNPKCQPPWVAEELQMKVENAYTYASQNAGNATPEAEFTRIEMAASIITYRRDKYGHPKKTLHNMMNVLLDPAHPFQGALAFNEFYAVVSVIKKLPWSEPKKEWTDLDSSHLQLWCSSRMHMEIPTDMVDKAVLLVSQEKKLHPIRDYINSIKWDGITRLDTWLVKCAGAEDNLYTHTISRKMLIQAVNRAFNPGCQADYIAVLEGKQGIGKTTLIKILAGPWYGDITVDPHNKDTIDSMRGKWFVELAEMEVTRRTEAQALKAFITRDTDSVRLAYARRSIDFPRQSVFIGTINPDATHEYLNDQTGNRRFWPIYIQALDRDMLRAMRDQLFAEALHSLKNGETTYIENPHVELLASEEQALRQSSDPWEHSIRSYLETQEYPNITTKDIYKFALHGAEASMTGVHQRRIANALRVLNYTLKSVRDKKTHKITRMYCYDDMKETNDLLS